MQGAKPLAKTSADHCTSADGFSGIIGRRKRAVDALASTVPFFGVADILLKIGAVKGLGRDSGLSEAREHMLTRAKPLPLYCPIGGTVIRTTEHKIYNIRKPPLIVG